MAGKVGRRPGQIVKKPVTKSNRCDLVFPVGRCSSMIKRGRHAERVGVGAGIFTAAVLEYLTIEVLELAGNACLEHKKKTIIPRHLQLAIRNDEELNKVFCMAMISNGGVLPNINPELFAKKKNGKMVNQEGTVDTQ